MRYEFTNLATGQPCCKSDDVRFLCAACKEQATAAPLAPTSPDLINALRVKRNLAPIPQATVGQSVTATVQTGAAPDAPSLIDAIQKNGARR